ncbi:diguanylate cyclase domain protein [Methyloversatilis sp. RAC08]|uniref:diguanylate cyclase domain-containing protein n=1 Tax=Methyloversatilis sp. RAC08 TaxID=1842540 RepID=UPI00083E26C0|nr:diguanylate cyclase [Methyloversatilis sp. RAC08]AOF82636.1 diguanylate cyclase domain protein [Methyloversatilis sp. RAC08]
MNNLPPDDELPGASAGATAAQFEAHTRALKAELTRLQRELDDLKHGFNATQAADLLEANENLVLAALQAEAIAESATLTLDELARNSQRDPLTGTPNRGLMNDRLDSAITLARRRGTHIAVLFVDLDYFKPINDTLGHPVGDAVLCQVARRLESVVRDSDTVSRYGGDEFLVLLAEVNQASDAAQIAAKMLASLGEPCHVGDLLLRLSASIGISLFPQDGEDVATLIDRADVAMYRAKREGGGCFDFHREDIARAVGLEARVGPVQPLPISHREFVLAEREMHVRNLREANENLTLALLAAQALDEQADQMRSQQIRFLAMVAENLRKPLQPIRTAAEMLSRAPNDEALRARLPAIIKRQVRRMSRLVDDLVAAGPPGAADVMCELRRIDLMAVLGEASDQARRALDGRRQRLVTSWPADLPPVRGQAVRLIGIIARLLENASSHSADGSEIRLSVDIVDGWAHITVSDDGAGIAADALPAIFAAAASSVPSARRSGMALHRLRDLVEAQGGSLCASSAGPGLGSRFSISLPQDAQVVDEANG